MSRQTKLSAGCTFHFPSPYKLRNSTLLSLIYFPVRSQRESFRNTVSLNNLYEEFLTTTKTSCAVFSSTLGCQVPWVWSLVKQSQKHQNTWGVWVCMQIFMLCCGLTFCLFCYVFRTCWDLNVLSQCSATETQAHMPDPHIILLHWVRYILRTVTWK